MTSDMFKENLQYAPFPDHMKKSIEAYVNRGRPMGGFLTALFANDLMKACSRADEINITLIADYARFMYNSCPAGCVGSYKNVATWLGLDRLEEGEK